MIEPLIIGTNFWQAQVPGDWCQQPFEPSEVVYFEAADGTAGVYVSAWRVGDQSVAEAVRSAVAADRDRLPTTSAGLWAATRSDVHESAGRVEGWAEYRNEAAGYRIASRYVGHNDKFVRATFHDYDCTDEAESRARSSPILQSLVLREGDTE